VRTENPRIWSRETYIRRDLCSLQVQETLSRSMYTYGCLILVSDASAKALTRHHFQANSCRKDASARMATVEMVDI
jgi:DeoR/GlpR family transcriptional regulator of sugar metabolism